MSDNRPPNPTVLQLTDTDFAGESTIWLVKDVLSGHFNPLVQVLACQEEV